MLENLFGTVITTQIVADEFALPLPKWVIIKNPKDRNNQMILEATLDKGEASAIALAMEHANCLLVIDELKGRKLAKHLGLSITGTLGLIVQAKISGHISSVRPVLKKVEKTNFRISEEIERVILTLAGE